MQTDPVIASLEAAARQHPVALTGGTMVWREFGTRAGGVPLVLLHGGHGSWLHWARNILPWSARTSVFVPDLPGYGESAAVPEPSLDSLVGATRQALDALLGPDAPVVLVGFSFGALVAACLAAQRPAVQGLVLLGPAGHGGDRRAAGRLLQWREFEPYSSEWQHAMRHNLLMHMLHAPAAVDGTALRIHGEACLRTRFRSKEIARGGGLFERIAQYGGPCTLLVGEHDVTCVPKELASQAAKQARPVPLQLVPEAGHWVQYEEADIVNAAVLGFLESLERARPS